MPKSESLLSRLELVHPTEPPGNIETKGETEIHEKSAQVRVSIRTSRDTHDELRRIAYEYRTTIQSVVQEAIEHAIRQYPRKR